MSLCDQVLHDQRYRDIVISWCGIGSWLGCAMLLLSLLSSTWLLYVCSPRSKHLSSRLLWHLAVADFSHAVLQLLSSEVLHIFIWKTPGPMNIDDAVVLRCSIHFFLITLCFLEVLIAATVATSSMQEVGAAKGIARAIPFSWVAAAVCQGIDYYSLKHNTVLLAFGQASGYAPVLATLMGTCFFLTLFFYYLAINHLMSRPCSGTAARQASMQALLYPLNFFLTFLPVWLVYIGCMREFSGGFCHAFASACLYSNGWVNAATYSFQNGRFCLSPKYHDDGFGRVLSSLDTSFLNDHVVAFPIE